MDVTPQPPQSGDDWLLSPGPAPGGRRTPRFQGGTGAAPGGGSFPGGPGAPGGFAPGGRGTTPPTEPSGALKG